MRAGQEAKSYDYNGDKVFAAALDRSRERSGRMERGAIAVGAAVVDARSRLADPLRRPHDPLVDQGLARIPCCLRPRAHPVCLSPAPFASSPSAKRHSAAMTY
ncbi:hypothetical protein KRR38_33765 [Novosphingobium sp. G106]|uniref:hypothetical protein n=1 Tax=Novosphingobium sp. G106 TaxID=2849500 RepID=UPI001C2D96C2|nr:hypothetical protein [Novosphingobium sp. G106]MBV1692471.1 hypothetical protein [Novosphingobium sp. G106]